MKTLFPSRNRRVIASIRHIQAASEFLPDPNDYSDEFHNVYLEEYDMNIAFTKIKFSNRESGKFYRWVFDGRMVV